MDPQATWSQLQDACRDQDWDAADEFAQSLLNWPALCHAADLPPSSRAEIPTTLLSSGNS